MTNYTDNSSSSEDESMKQALREATDKDLFTNSLFFGDKTDESEKKKVNNFDNKLKENKQESQRFYNFGISIHFQEFVGKKLREHLDREIQLVEVTPRKLKRKKIIGGIKLLNESIDVINCDKEVISIIPKKKKRKLRDKSENNISNFEKCKEAAVDPEFILSKSQVLSWNERPKGTVFTYKKMPDGTLLQYTIIN